MPPALRLTAFGDPSDHLRLDDVPSEPLGAGDVRVRLRASPVDPMDQLILRGHYPLRPPLPATPGAEGCVEVTEVGAEVTDWAAGDLALLPIRAGAWRTERVCRPDGLYRLPPGSDPVQASMLRVNGATALALIDGLSTGSWVAQTLGSGGVGQAVVQLARAQGLHTVSVVRSAGWVSTLEGLGADVVHVSEEPNFARGLRKELKARRGGTRIARALDGVGGEATAALGRLVGRGGEVVHYGAMSREGPRLQVADAIFRGVTLRGFWLYQLNRDRGAEAERAALDALCADPPQFAVDSRWPLSAWREALARSVSSERRGRVVLVADDLVGPDTT